MLKQQLIIIYNRVSSVTQSLELQDSRQKIS